MVPRRRRRRPWYRTRAYRLTRTALIVAVLVTVVRCGGHHGPDFPDRVRGPVLAESPAESPARSPSESRAAPAAGAVDGRPRASEPTATPTPRATPTPAPPPLPRSPATNLRVPSLGIDAPVVGLKVGADHQLGTPPVDKANLVGWYQDGPSPGETGTAVAVGHRDTRTGAAVFAALAQIPRDSRIEVRRADGRAAVYTVDRVRVFDKARFPDKEVYGPSRRPELRMITCGGLFNRRTGYTSNVVVFAHLTATR
ncbi:class F sortase [Streptomyces sp. NPDC047043]|uniref:class F sortase n=1 Tax=Streptomyces sp. NPDC047043 TaxID=3154497 RepID=UPI0033FA468B